MRSFVLRVLGFGFSFGFPGQFRVSGFGFGSGFQLWFRVAEFGFGGRGLEVGGWGLGVGGWGLEICDLRLTYATQRTNPCRHLRPFPSVAN